MLLQVQQQWAPARYVAMGIFVAMGLSDGLDGYLARRRGQVTRLGTILDPLADKLLITCAAILLASAGASVSEARLHTWVVVCIVGKDLWVVIGFVVVFLMTSQVKVQPTRAGKACTTGQLVMVAFVLIAPDVNRLGQRIGTHLAEWMGWLVALLCVIAVISYTRLGLMFLAESGNGNARSADKNDAETQAQPAGKETSDGF